MTKPFENAFWIWDDGDPAPVNSYRIFRKEIIVPEHWPLRPILRICADTRYKLYVNGMLTSHGPAPSAQGIYAYDETTIMPGVAGSKLNITVIVNYVGARMFFYYRNRGGLIAEIEDVVTDSSWLVANTSPYNPDTPRISEQQAFVEDYDPQKEPKGMYRFDFEDFVSEDIDPTQWKAASIVEKAYGTIWPTIESSAIPSYGWLSYVHMKSAKLIEIANCKTSGGSDAAERIFNDVLSPITKGAVTENKLDRNQAKWIIEPQGQDIALTFDFGHEVSGFVGFRADTEGEQGYIDIGYDEALRIGEVPGGLKTFDSGGSGTRWADRLRLPGSSVFESFNSRAFRYLRLVVRDAVSKVYISDPSIRETLYPGCVEGYEVKAEHSVFTCSDARLDRIYEIGVRTLQLCMENRYMDCPARERSQWVGDVRIQAIAARYAFGDHLLHRRFIRQTALSQYPDGRIDPVGPGEWDLTGPRDWYPNAPCHPIPGFVALYILSVYDYYLMTGDGDLVKEVLPHVQRALGWLGSFGAAEGGLLINVPGWNFTDWAPGMSGGNEGITAAVNLFYLLSLRASAKLAEASGDIAAASSNRTRADMIARAFDSLFWNPLRAVYVDSVINGEQSTTASQHVNTLALLCEIGVESRRMSIAEELLDDESLTQIGSPYFSFYLMHALAKIGWHQDALDYMRDKWGGMMDAGATSWWEDWAGTGSRCHAWSVAPNIWLPQQILGVTAHEPGFACVNIAPKPCDLKWAKGIIPIPQGSVTISWERSLDGKKFTLDVNVPTGVHLRPILPCGPKDELYVDGQPVDEDSIIRRVQTGAELAVLPGSGYRFEVITP